MVNEESEGFFSLCALGQRLMAKMLCVTKASVLVQHKMVKGVSGDEHTRRDEFGESPKIRCC